VRTPTEGVERLNFFEQELRKLVDIGIDLDDVKFAGRACFGDLGGQNRAKMQFVTTGHADHYSALSVDILNRTDGKVDSLLFRFADIWGKKPVNNPNFRDGVIPHIWVDGLKSEWYVYKPTPADFEKLAGAVNDYLSVFQERGVDREQQKSTFDKAMSRGKEKSETYKAQKAQKPTKTKTNKEARE
jgi:hypothetical protein